MFRSCPYVAGLSFGVAGLSFGVAGLSFGVAGLSSCALVAGSYMQIKKKDLNISYTDR